MEVILGSSARQHRLPGYRFAWIFFLQVLAFIIKQ